VTEADVASNSIDERPRRRDWRDDRVYGPGGYIGTVDECLSALAGGMGAAVRAELHPGPGTVVVLHAPADRRNVRPVERRRESFVAKEETQ
jgi:hypothetical protein